MSVGPAFGCIVAMSVGLSVVFGCSSATPDGDDATSSRSALVAGLRPYGSLGVGASHACAVLPTGEVRCWGDNSHGQLGDGTTTMRAAPTVAAGVVRPVMVAAGGLHTCALHADGSVGCWGDNSHGELGNASYVESHTEVAVSGLANVSAIAAAYQVTCAVIAPSGTVSCWGDNELGALGTGTHGGDHLTPATVLGLSGVVAVAPGGYQTCALKATGEVYCWGTNLYGSLGNGTTTSSYTPVRVTGITNATAITSGIRHACALLADGTVRCWGDNFYGTLGDGTQVDSSVPIAPVGGLAHVVAVVAAESHTCAVSADRSVRCWGDNWSNDTGNPAPVTPQATPYYVPGLSGVTSIGVGYAHTCAELADGSIRCWGRNDTGQLGNGSTTDAATPVLAASGVRFKPQIVSRGPHTCVLIADGTVRCWGPSFVGAALGVGDTLGRNVPTATQPLYTSAVSITAGDTHTCAVLADGTGQCWGANGSGQLGTGDTTQRLAPTDISGLLGFQAVEISAGWNHTCALLSDGHVQCWGGNESGQLGTGDTVSRLTPTTVPGLADVTAVSAGGGFTCALLANGTVRCWGANGSGQLGDGTTTSRSVPAPTGALYTRATSITTGDIHACALLVDGTAQCWGFNEAGQLGDGTTTTRLTPVDVSGLLGYEGVAITSTMYKEATCALLADGTVRCWGFNLNGIVGDGTTAYRRTPTAVAMLTNVASIACGSGHACAVRSDGATFCWGTGSLGNPTTSVSYTPLAVPGLP